MSDKYNERVRSIAEEMAKYHNDMCEAFDADEAKIHAAFCDKFARIAVAHMAEAVRELCFASPPEWIEEKLKEQGLIPDSAQEGKGL
jgi:hypothetical protein